ncbi:MAG: hypothetical protein D6754_03185 [Alphaproteobacteria bacterium]|nr:MAG: hypothetical protein D6754_03185 [Alphaproteobacteria bacterium]
MFVLCLPLAAPGAEPPTADQLRQQIGPQIPPYWKIDQISVTAQVNRGDEVDPLWAQRFEAQVTPKTALYVPDPQAGQLMPGFVLLVETVSGDASRILYGTSVSQLRAGRWQSEVSLENPLTDLGKPRDFFGQPNFVIGSEELAAFHKARAAMVEADLQAQYSTKTQRLEARLEQQRRRLEADLERQRMEFRVQLDAERQKLESEHNRKLENLQRMFERQREAKVAEIAKLKAAFDKQRETLLAKQAEELKKLENDIAAETDAARRESAALSGLVEALAERTMAVEMANNARREAFARALHSRIALLDEVTQALNSEDVNAQIAAFDAALMTDAVVLVDLAFETGLSSSNPDFFRHAALAGLTHPNSGVRKLAVEKVLGKKDGELLATLIEKSPSDELLTAFAAESPSAGLIRLIKALPQERRDALIARVSATGPDSARRAIAKMLIEGTGRFALVQGDGQARFGQDDQVYGAIMAPNRIVIGTKINGEIVSHPKKPNSIVRYRVKTIGLPLLITVRSHPGAAIQGCVYARAARFYSMRPSTHRKDVRSS